MSDVPPSDPLAALGLEVNAAPRQLALANGLVLHYRPPEGVDWTVARERVQSAFEARDAFATACQRYAWAAGDAAQLLDADRWSEAGVFCTAVELAAMIVHRVERTVDGELRHAPGSLELFRVLFKQGDALDRFWTAARRADLELISAKKEPAPSPGTSSAAGANTAEGAASSSPAGTRTSARRAARKS